MRTLSLVKFSRIIFLFTTSLTNSISNLLLSLQLFSLSCLNINVILTFSLVSVVVLLP